MSDGLAASRLELEAKRRKNLDEISSTDTEIASLEERLTMLRSRKAMLQDSVANLTAGIDALREVERNGVSEA